MAITLWTTPQMSATTLANVLSTLPANLITTAMRSAPPTCSATTSHVLNRKPCSQPCLSIASKSPDACIAINWRGSVKRLN